MTRVDGGTCGACDHTASERKRFFCDCVVNTMREVDTAYVRTVPANASQQLKALCAKRITTSIWVDTELGEVLPLPDIATGRNTNQQHVASASTKRTLLFKHDPSKRCVKAIVKTRRRPRGRGPFAVQHPAELHHHRSHRHLKALKNNFWK